MHRVYDGKKMTTNPLKLFLDLDQLGNTVVHLLDGLVLSESKTSLIGDVVDTTFCLGVLTAGSAHL